jgi:RNA polymerase sigma-70 factor, ECF subfamily
MPAGGLATYDFRWNPVASRAPAAPPQHSRTAFVSPSDIEKRMQGTVPIFDFPDGGEVAFKRLFDAYFELVFRKILLVVLRREDAEELTHDLFLNLWKRKDTLVRPDNWEAYLSKAANFKAIDFIRSQKKKTALSLSPDLPDLPDRHYAPDAPLLNTEMEERYLRALESLPPQCRLAFQLSRFEAKSYREIADALGVSPKTVENQISKALRLLRRWLLAVVWAHYAA